MSAQVFTPESLTGSISTSLENGLPNGNSTAGTKEQAENGEHPDAEAIRRQVEYYFSDENLPNDIYLLQCCGGRQNIPVSLNRICGFKRMRGFKPKKIVPEALRKSAFLEISANGKTVKRRVPLACKTLLDKDDSDGEIAYHPRTAKEIIRPVPLLPQQKQEYPPGMTKNMMKPTGFEDTYVEGPITLAQVEEELSMYDPDKPFVERIELAIQRFKQKRRMHEMYSKVFNKWMKFGGVECNPKMFGSVSKQELAAMDAEEITRALAIHHVPLDREDKNQWVVDFEGVCKAFLSSSYPAQYGYEPKQIKAACQVLRSFYNYLLFHDVCNEYSSSILSARAVCDKAEVELVKASRAGLALPGAFNVAASTIFGGYHAGLYSGDKSWADPADDDWLGDTSGVGMKNEEAMVVFKTGIAVYGTDEQYEVVNGEGIKGIRVLSNETVGLEVIKIEHATQDVLNIYDEQNKTWKHKLLLQSLGKLICKLWPIPSFHEWDLPRDKYPNSRLLPQEKEKEYEFWVEDEALRDCFEGMKMEAKVMTLSCGLKILDSIVEVMVSFYEWLPNELWMDSKPKVFRLLKKGLEGLDDESENENKLDGYAEKGEGDGDRADE